MMPKKMFDADMIRIAVTKLKPNNELFEVRLIHEPKNNKSYSGYFKSAEVMLSELAKLNLENYNVYITLNEISEACFSRTQRNRFIITDTTTSGSDILRYEFLFVDIDPERASGISSTKAELNAAIEKREKVRNFLAELGFCEPLYAMSGNGCHLLYRIDLHNDKEHENLVSGCLKALSEFFSDSSVKIDTVNSNPARICKLYGTLAQKGSDTPERPHRMSIIEKIPDHFCATSEDRLKALAGMANSSDQQKEYNNCNNDSGSEKFDLIDFMQRNGLTFYTQKAESNCTVYYLNECPFDPSHTHGDARIFHYSNGAMNFKCHHNSCSSYHWKELRLKYEPHCYDYKKDDHIEKGYQKMKSRQKAYIPETDETEIDLDIPTLEDFEEKAPELVACAIPKGGITALVADGGIGKTYAWVGALAALTRGDKSLFDYGGNNNDCIDHSPKTVMFFSAEDGVSEVLKRRFRLNGAIQKNVRTIGLDDEKGRFEHIQVNSTALNQLIDKYRPEICVLDPLQAFIPSNVKMSERNAMRQCMKPLIAMANKYKMAFIIVVHSNKRDGASGRNRVSDSSDIWDMSRSVILMGNTEDPNIKYMSHEKSNYGQQMKTVLFSIRDEVVTFEGLSNKKDADFVAEAGHNPWKAEKKSEAKSFVIETIRMKGRTVKELRADTEFQNSVPNGCKFFKGLADEDIALSTSELDELALADKIKISTLGKAKTELKDSGAIIYKNKGFSGEKKFYVILKASQSNNE